MPLPLRLSRLRKNHTVRQLLQETRLAIQDFILPLFIHEGLTTKQAISSMPGHYQLSLYDLEQEIHEIMRVGIQAVILFGIPIHKDSQGSSALKENNIIQQAIRRIKTIAPTLLIITDLCFCEYTDHGHCGLLIDQCIDHDETAQQLAKQAVSHAQAGADWIAPSSMTDGMIQTIRTALDIHGFEQVVILSYAIKYCSAWYGPFREAANGAPKFGDRQSYQMHPANAVEALREAKLDIAEGADILMVKPAGNYLDIIYRVKQSFPEIPLCAYQVSGEFTLIKQCAALGTINEQAAMLESLLAIKRAGANLIISYFAKELGMHLTNK